MTMSMKMRPPKRARGREKGGEERNVDLARLAVVVMLGIVLGRAGVGFQRVVAEGAVFCISPAAAGRSLQLFGRCRNAFFFNGGNNLFCVIIDSLFHFCHPLSPLVGDILSYRNVQPAKVD